MMTFGSRWRRSWWAALALAVVAGFAGAGVASAQIRVDLSLQRSMFIRFEPLIAVVSITNMSGAELELADEGNYKWFSFKIETADGRLVPPYNPDYQLSPIQIGPGQTAKRMVNLTPLYPLTEYGVYRLSATIYSRQLGRFFSSNPPLNVEVTEGRLMWQQTAGVPGGGATREISLLSHRLPTYTQVYLRIQDVDSGSVFCTHQLGRFVTAFGVPNVELDAENNVHVLQSTAPKEFLYTKVDLEGRVLERKKYLATTNKPSLRRDAMGGIQVAGATFVDPDAVPPPGQGPDRPSVSDRPVPLPTEDEPPEEEGAVEGVGGSETGTRQEP